MLTLVDGQQCSNGTNKHHAHHHDWKDANRAPNHVHHEQIHGHLKGKQVEIGKCHQIAKRACTCFNGARATSQERLMSKLESDSLADSATVEATEAEKPGGDGSSFKARFL